MNLRPDTVDHPTTILIVDDERHNRQLLKVMLTPEGYSLPFASSGQEALDIVAREPPDLILLDIMMPDLDGYQVVAKIKGDIATKNIPVIMVTALDDRNARMLGLVAGAEDFLSKPVDRAELCVRVRNLLRLKAFGEHFDKYSRDLEGQVASRTADLAERTKQAAVLAEQAALLDLAQDAIVVLDMHGRILFWNRGAEVMYGWLSQEALGRDARELLRAELSESFEDIEDELLRERRWEGEAIHHDREGTRLIVASRWALQRDADGVPVRILTINNDITGRKQADSDRHLLTERLSLATAVAKVGVWERDLATNELSWDTTMFEIYGLSPLAPVLYEQWAAAVHPEDLPAVETALQKVIEDKGRGSAEYRIVRTDGSSRNVAAVERAVLDDLGNVTRLVGVEMDVTERKVAEEALGRSRQDQIRFKVDFLSHVSHELRSPLTAIKQFTSILLSGIAGKLTREQNEYQQIVLRNILQLQSMIDDLLEVTRLETGKVTLELESVSVANAVTDALNTLQGTADAKSVTLSCDLPPDLFPVHADPIRLRQILIILLDNAVKFTPGGGTVTIKARLFEDDPRFLLLEVSDTGCGMGPEIVKRVFERLYQASEQCDASRKGLGLGLYICKELVTRQGGIVRVESQLQMGTTFSFTVPVFSLGSLLTPLFKDDKWPDESVALVTVEFGLSEAWTSQDSLEKWSNEARGVLQRCFLPDADLLLPNISVGSARLRFFVAAFAEERGASVLVDRIRKQFERHPRLKETGMTCSVSYSMLPALPRESGAFTEVSVASMVARIEKAVKSHLLNEAVKS